MGQKINPISLRLGINRTWDSRWHSQNQYKNLLHEDLQIRKYLEAVYEKAGLIVGGCSIERSVKDVYIKLSIGELTDLQESLTRKSASDDQKLKQLNKINLEKVQETIQYIVQAPVNLEVTKIDATTSALLLAKDIAKKLEQRQPFGTILKRTLRQARNESSISGIKIQCSGRLNGEDIARTEWVKEGEIPLQTLNAKIDYGYARSYTIYGVCGIKVWLCKK